MVTITCPFCQHRIQCLQCDNGICEACGADLWAEEAIPFTDIYPEHEYTTLEYGNLLRRKQQQRGGEN